MPNGTLHPLGKGTVSTTKVLLPNNIELVVEAVDGAEFVSYDPIEAIPIEHTDAVVLVGWGNPRRHLRDAAARLTGLRLVQMLSAGTDTAEEAGFAADVTIASGRSLHDRPVAEHTLALVLAAARRLHTTTRAQIGHRWAGEIGGVQQEPSPGLFSTLRGARVLIWGFGSIGTTLAPYLTMLGATVTGVARSAGTRDGYRVITEEQLADELPETDVLIDILPATDATYQAVNASVLAQLPKHAWLVNVGRGATVDEGALLAAIRSGALAGAALDVTAKEPLPAASPLWDEPNIILTPHAAGGRPLGAAELIRGNVVALLAGDPLRNAVERA
ncbi:NAD(P)-dependent oxidoreductase [Salinibacterium sp. ZJ454]|uniref:NAD(P)-dependent oxidoreductase n=1 Tax=Salinibacterium sp. ZJ454 TaxID=2708339 RepID=UPI001FBB518B|nr:NAD(P)-dependent oxidoreductase [Salinibacterium sp. ZJ454]